MPSKRRDSQVLRLLAEVIDYGAEILEILLAILIILTVLFGIIKLADIVVVKSIREQLSKSEILAILDLALLLVLAVDILRTLAVAIRRRSLPVRIVIEAAMIAILREIIAVEIRHLDYKMIIALGFTFVLLAASWAGIGVLQKREMISPTAIDEEE
ncbi:MAG: phosphate-starvation-inducible PsiE family protein [Desulfurococcales archaeon]|nr:phosphate-starvation-inducible PsiE family protein [Desulfurococcales archaeon]